MRFWWTGMTVLSVFGGQHYPLVATPISPCFPRVHLECEQFCCSSGLYLRTLRHSSGEYVAFPFYVYN